MSRECSTSVTLISGHKHGKVVLFGREFINDKITAALGPDATASTDVAPIYERAPGTGEGTPASREAQPRKEEFITK